MSPGLISRVVVADKVALARRMLDGIRTLPLGDLEVFTADPRMVTAAHSTGQPDWEVIDLVKNVQVGGNNGTGTATTSYVDSTRPPPLANDGGYLPKAYVAQGGHPCVKVYVLPTSDNPGFPKSNLSDGAGLSDANLQTIVDKYGLSDGVHVAQQNISRRHPRIVPTRAARLQTFAAQSRRGRGFRSSGHRPGLP